MEFSIKNNTIDFDVTVWNECKSSPIVCFDFNNVLNAYTMKELVETAKFYNSSYAIVSLLHGKGRNYWDLYRRSKETGECIVAITLKDKSQRRQLKHAETSLKWTVIRALKWNDVEWALDDKPHEWKNPEKELQAKPLKLDPTKKDVYKIKIMDT